MKPQILALAAVLFFAGCAQPGDEPGPGGNGDPDAVTISGFAFHPEVLEVPLGTTVIWTNEDDAPHTASADDHGWDTGTLEPGQSDGHTFNDEGEFPYHCEFHPDMTGTIIVVR